MENYQQEIHDLHQFFEDYLSGKIDPGPMALFENSLDSGFTIISSEGNIIDRDGIIDYVRNAHAQRPNFRIWTENVTLRQHIGDVMLVSYEEWQTIDETTTSRTSTVAFKEDATMPNGLIWLYVHESGLKEVPAKS